MRTEPSHPWVISQPYKVIETTEVDDSVTLPTVTTTYWDEWANPERIDEIKEVGDDGTRTTTYTYHKENDADGHPQIKYLEKIEQSGGLNPYTADYDEAEQLTHYTDTYGSVDVGYSGSTVTRTEKSKSGSTVRTLTTTYTGDMTQATTVAK